MLSLHFSNIFIDLKRFCFSVSLLVLRVLSAPCSSARISIDFPLHHQTQEIKEVFKIWIFNSTVYFDTANVLIIHVSSFIYEMASVKMPTKYLAELNKTMSP